MACTTNQRLLALAVLAAFVATTTVACGDGKRRQSNIQKISKKMPESGKLDRNQGGDGSGQGGQFQTTPSSATLQEVEAMIAQSIEAGKAITSAQLPMGKYELAEVTTYFKLMDSSSGNDIRAISTQTVNQGAIDQTKTERVENRSSNTVDSGLSLAVPIQMQVANGKEDISQTAAFLTQVDLQQGALKNQLQANQNAAQLNLMDLLSGEGKDAKMTDGSAIRFDGLQIVQEGSHVKFVVHASHLSSKQPNLVVNRTLIFAYNVTTPSANPIKQSAE